jgi:membrane-associated phospholipid phosphatase
MTESYKEIKYLNKKLLLLLFLCSVIIHAQEISFSSIDDLKSASQLSNQYGSLSDYITYLSFNQTDTSAASMPKINQLMIDSSSSDLSHDEKFDSYLPIAVSSVFLTLVLIPSDNSTYTYLRDLRNNNPFIKTISPVITQLGNGKFAICLFGGFGIYHFISGNEKSWDVTKVGFESFLLSGVTVQLLKNIFSRERPSSASVSGGKWNGVFARFKKENKNKSIANFDAFPSGHSTTAFAAASTLSYFYPDGAVPYVAYTLATAVSISRVMEATHWVSDCVLGAGIGYLSTQLIIKWNDFPSNASVGIMPVNNGLVLNFGYKF